MREARRLCKTPEHRRQDPLSVRYCTYSPRCSSCGPALCEYTLGSIDGRAGCARPQIYEAANLAIPVEREPGGSTVREGFTSAERLLEPRNDRR